MARDAVQHHHLRARLQTFRCQCRQDRILWGDPQLGSDAQQQVAGPVPLQQLGMVFQPGLDAQLAQQRDQKKEARVAGVAGRQTRPDQGGEIERRGGLGLISAIGCRGAGF